MKRRLALVAVTEPWRLSRAELELGDALYPEDPGVEVVRDPEYPLLYVYTVLDAMRAFRLVVLEPPAYVERLVPVQSLAESWEDVVASASQLLGGTRLVLIEVHPRGFVLPREGMSKREASRLYARRLAERLGVRVSRHAPTALVVEDTREGAAMALLGRGEDRVELWRRRRMRRAGRSL